MAVRICDLHALSGSVLADHLIETCYSQRGKALGYSDSTASIAGQILGTMGGVEVIPKDWLEGLGLRHVVERVANDLYDVFYDDAVLPAEEYPAW